MSAFNLLLALIVALVLAALLVLVLFAPTPTRSAHTPPGPPGNRDLTSPVSRQDGRYWLAGLIYYNPDDPEPIVPKRYGWGWTVNFGHPQGKVFLVIMLALVLLPIVLAILVPGLPHSGCHSLGCQVSP